MLKILIIPALFCSTIATAQQVPTYVFQGANVITMEAEGGPERAVGGGL